MSKQKMYMVVDTETAEEVDVNPLPYDIGYAICNRYGDIFLERSFVIADIFLDLKESMQSAYYAEKIPRYWEEIKAGKRKLVTMYTARKTMLQDIKDYKIRTVAAYNMNFDRTALNNLIRYCTKSKWRYWFPWGIEYNCIWHMACQLLATRKAYIKFCLEHDLISESGNIQTGAEMIYKYLMSAPDFIESHTGLEDVKIEVEIMAYCYKQKKKMDKTINRLCWQIPQKTKRALGL